MHALCCIEMSPHKFSSSSLLSPQGLLALEGELTPILVQMVKSANMNGLLDSDSDSLTDCQQKVKARLHEIMQKDQEFTPEDYQKVFGKPDILRIFFDLLNLVRCPIFLWVLSHVGQMLSDTILRVLFKQLDVLANFHRIFQLIKQIVKLLLRKTW